MTVAELRYGALNSSHPQRSLTGVEALLLAPIEIAGCGEDAAAHHAQIRLALRARPIAERDLVIAATARSGGFTIVTGNQRHLARVPGLSAQDWTTSAK
jgi:tRNA(fMet)-specific endonuclease VapC